MATLPLSIIISAWKEPETVAQLIETIEQDSLPRHELVVVAPDDETLNVVKEKRKKYPSVRALRDEGNGKPAALIMTLKNVKGENLVFTDGDVRLSKNAVSLLLRHLEDSRVGAVTGRPVSISSHEEMLGYWSHVLTGVAHDRRQRAAEQGWRFFCSGYLFGIRKELFPELTPDILSEDGYITHCVYEKGFRVAYEPKAEVFVKYPTTFDDWIVQKRRSAGGYNQIRDRYGIHIRSLWSEAFGGAGLLKYVRNPKEFAWLWALYMSRLYLWWRIRQDVNESKSHREIWKRVETTK